MCLKSTKENLLHYHGLSSQYLIVRDHHTLADKVCWDTYMYLKIKHVWFPPQTSSDFVVACHEPPHTSSFQSVIKNNKSALSCQKNPLASVCWACRYLIYPVSSYSCVFPQNWNHSQSYQTWSCCHWNFCFMVGIFGNQVLVTVLLCDGIFFVLHICNNHMYIFK